MFYKCTSLKTVPELPAMTLVRDSYYQMFYGCVSLTSVPELPATTLERACYCQMFSGCTSLVINTTVPGTKWSLPANAVVSSEGTTTWNSGMFSGTGGNFTGAPVLGTVYYVASALAGLDAPFEDIDLSRTVTYNLNGQLVGADTKGLLIQNGQKVLKR